VKQQDRTTRGSGQTMWHSTSASTHQDTHQEGSESKNFYFSDHADNHWQHR